MDRYLESQYEEFIEAIHQYQQFAQAVSNRIFNFRLGRNNQMQLVRKLPEMIREVKPLSWRTPKWLWRMFTDNVSDEERHTDFYPILASEFRIEALCDYLAKKFESFDFEKLKELHELKGVRLSRLNFFRDHGIILAVATILLKTIPQSVVEKYVEYSTYEANVFWITIGLLGYLLLLVLPFWLRYNNAKETHAQIGDLLTYITIKQEKKRSNPFKVLPYRVHSYSGRRRQESYCKNSILNSQRRHHMLASSRSVRVYPALLLGVLVTLTLLSCSSLATEQVWGSPSPATTSTETLLFYAMTPTVTPPIIEFPDLDPSETPAVVRGIINSSNATLKVYAGPGSEFPVLADLNNKMMVDVIGKSQGGWLYISDFYPHSELRGWVDDKYVLIEENDASKIGFVQIVTPTMPPFLP